MSRTCFLIAAIATLGFSHIADAQQVSSTRSTSAIQTCTDQTPCPMNSDLSSRLRVLLYGAASGAISSNVTSISIPLTSTALYTAGMMHYLNGSQWDRLTGTNGAIYTTPLPIAQISANTFANGGSVANVISATPTTMSYISWRGDTAAPSIITLYDSASACSGTIRAVYYTGSLEPNSTTSLAIPIAFANGITLCQNSASAIFVAIGRY